MPQPLAPRTTTQEPGGTSIETPSSAWCDPNRFEMPLADRAADVNGLPLSRPFALPERPRAMASENHQRSQRARGRAGDLGWRRIRNDRVDANGQRGLAGRCDQHARSELAERGTNTTIHAAASPSRVAAARYVASCGASRHRRLRPLPRARSARAGQPPRVSALRRDEPRQIGQDEASWLCRR